MSSKLESLLGKIDEERERHLSLGKAILEADGCKLFSLDFLAVAALNRSLSNCSAFTQMVRAQNYLIAASLVRLQLDTFLRFFASYLVSDPHEFATSVLAGTEIRKLKDRSGVPMTDRHLVQSVSLEFPWVHSVYKSTSGFIHLSNKHIFSAIQSVQGDGRLSMLIGSDPERFPSELWVEMSEGFTAATEALFRYVDGWAFTKANPHLVRAAREQVDEC
ncbi:hypothetical protein ACDH70_21865 [Xanthomonas axonopodis pv. poinsettiicola]|uniref:hypothetical protein n=1 Tax=Xanthomonas TaxID=338 RepID=UPI001E3D40AF|nr:hypothetical protein [Xanthomonas codiaei]MCC8535937.1 hypothetical protein [Xanthomonas codiaei]